MKIHDPISKRLFNVSSIKGKSILKKYVQKYSEKGGFGFLRYFGFGQKREIPQDRDSEEPEFRIGPGIGPPAAPPPAPIVPAAPPAAPEAAPPAAPEAAPPAAPEAAPAAPPAVPPAAPPVAPPAAAPVAPAFVPAFSEDIRSNRCDQFQRKQNINLDRLVVYRRRGLNRLFINNLDGSQSELIVGRTLGQGGFGRVVQYSLNGDPIIAVKFSTKRSYDLEKNILDVLKQGRISHPCGLTNYKHLGELRNERFEWAIACELMEGDLFYLSERRRQVDWNIFRGIMKNVLSQLKCLKDNHMYFVDLKLSNIFYKCTRQNHYKIYLGDLGSIYIDSYRDGIIHHDSRITYTFSPVDFRYQDGYPIEKLVVCSAGMLMLDLLHVYIPDPGLGQELIIGKSDRITRQIQLNTLDFPRDVNLETIINSTIEELHENRCTLEQLMAHFD